MGIHLKPWLGCVLQCQYCYEFAYHPSKGMPKMQYNIDAMFATLDQIIANTKATEITLHGGEPSAIPIKDLRLIFSKLKERGQRIAIQTSGANLTPEHIKLFKEYNVSVGISIDGPAELNRARGYFRGDQRLPASEKYTKKVERYIRRMLKEGISVGLIVVLNRYNASTKQLRARLKRWLEKLFEQGLSGVQMNLAFISGPLKKEIELTEDEATEAYLDFAEWAISDRMARYPSKAVLPFRYFIDNLLGLSVADCRFAPCDPTHTYGEINVLYDGSIGNCSRLAGPDGSEVLRTHDEPLYIRQKILRNIPMAEGGCGGCPYFKVCYGGCPAEAYDDDWRNKTRFCKAYYAVYDFYYRRLKNILPNVILVPDIDQENWQDWQDRQHGRWRRFAFDSMFWRFTQQPSSWTAQAKKA